MSAPPRIEPPDTVREIVRTLERGGHEAWCVGGAVRDALLGVASLDWDVATSATPAEVQRLFRRTVPVGIAFGTVGVLDRAGVLHEVTTFRRDVRTDGRHAEVVFGVSLDDDLARRDFTINAIAVHPESLVVRDPYGGRADLAARVVRAVGDASARMTEDRLRALRAIRFAARFGFAIAPETWSAIVASAPHLGRLSMERVRQELEKVMAQVAMPSRALRWYRDSGAFGTLVPALADLPDPHFEAVDRLARVGPPGRPDRTLLRLAALFAGTERVEQVLRHLRFSNAEQRVIAHWTRVLAELWAARAAERRAAPADAELRRWAARCGRTAVRAVARLALAGAGAPAGRTVDDGVPRAAVARTIYRRALCVAWRDPIELADLVVDGEDLRRAGVPPGPAIGETLRRLLDLVLEEPSLNTREALLARL